MSFYLIIRTEANVIERQVHGYFPSVSGAQSGPVLSSAACNRRLTGGFWSLSRPGVFYITKRDGTVDVWDLLDKTHEASMTQSVSPAAITCIYPFQVTCT